MSARRRGLILLVAVSGGALVLAGIFFLLNRERPYDPAFDTRVAAPAYSTGGPRVLYDEGHLNTHTTDAGYKPFADLIRNDGYRLEIMRSAITAPSLEGAAVLVVVLPRGTNDANDADAFTEDETGAIERWVRDGGSLLLVTDHWPYGAAADSLGRRFGIAMGRGMVEDAAHCDASLGESHLVFSRDNGLLADHPITRGRNPDERLDRVLTFTGQSLQGPPEAVAFMALADTAAERPPGPPQVTKSYGNVTVSMVYGEPVPARGRAQGIALETGRGRVVVLGEAGMLRAQRDGHGLLVGMNHPGYDNRQLALNIMHWLSRAT